MTPSVRVSLRCGLPPAVAFEGLVDELAAELAQHGAPWPLELGGEAQQGPETVVVERFEPGRRLRLRWNPAAWQPELATWFELRAEALDGGAEITLEHDGWDALVPAPEEQAGWFARQVAARLLRATTSDNWGDWLTDRMARRPNGAAARGVYREPVHHYPGFQVILGELQLTPADRLLDVGCGGGALLKLVLASGCTAAGLDHSPEMVRAALDQNHEAAAAGRLQVIPGDAAHLPWGDGEFTCAAMHGVFGFLSDPVAVLAEMLRVLRPGGRMVIAGADPELRGTPAAPEPAASRLRFYDDDGLLAVARAAGATDAQVLHPAMGELARAAGVPEEHLGMFTAHPARFLRVVKK